MKIKFIPTPPSRVGDGGYATFVASASDAQLTAERNRHFGYTDPERVAQARVVCDEIARREQLAEIARHFEGTSTRTLLAMNRQYSREYRATPTDANRRAVERSSIELSRRGA